MLLPPLPDKCSPRLRFVRRRSGLSRIRSMRLRVLLENSGVSCDLESAKVQIFEAGGKLFDETVVSRPLAGYEHIRQSNLKRRYSPPDRRSSVTLDAAELRLQNGECLRRQHEVDPD